MALTPGPYRLQVGKLRSRRLGARGLRFAPTTASFVGPLSETPG